MIVQFTSEQVPEFVDSFISLIGCIEEPLDSDHYLSPFIYGYDCWRRTDKLTNIPTEVLRLASISAGVMLLSNDWQHPSIKKWLIKRIRNNDQVKGILFEFRAATHYRHAHKKVSWLANYNGRAEPDIRVETHSGSVVYAECTRKMEKIERTKDVGQLERDILKTLAEKMNQRKDMMWPLHLVIYIPEEYKWESDTFNRSLCERVHKRFENDQYSVITAVTVISDELPNIGIDDQGNRYYDTSLPSITYRNPKPKHNFPHDFSCFDR